MDNFPLHKLEELNATYKPPKGKEWHQYCWFIGPKIRNNFHMLCKYCRTQQRGAKSRFLGHLGGYGEAKPCDEVNSDAKNFALAESQKKIRTKSIKLERTNAIISDDLKDSPEQQVRKMMEIKEEKCLGTPIKYTPSQFDSLRKMNRKKKKCLVYCMFLFYFLLIM